jgi:hypothetical protein
MNTPSGEIPCKRLIKNGELMVLLEYRTLIFGEEVGGAI